MTTIQDKNKAIAEFMDRYQGEAIEKCEDEIIISKTNDWAGNEVVKTRPFTYFDLKYHTSWDWLMPVVQKFLNISVEEFNYNAIGMAHLRYYKSIVERIPISTPIETVHDELYKYIKWYNQQTTKEVEP